MVVPHLITGVFKTLRFKFKNYAHFLRKRHTTYSQLSCVRDGNDTVTSSSSRPGQLLALGFSKSKFYVYGLYFKKLPSNHLKAPAQKNPKELYLGKKGNQPYFLGNDMTIFKGNGPWNTMMQSVFSNYFRCSGAKLSGCSSLQKVFQ